MKTIKPLISVIVPAFNEAKCLASCLRALQNQDFPKNQLEIIVVDNNSNDKTVPIAKKFGVKIIGEKKQGVIFAKQAGCLKAKGKIIAITDADTLVPKNWLTTIYQILKQKKYIGVTGPAIPQNLPAWGKINYFPGIFCLSLFYRLTHISLTMHGQNCAFLTKPFLKFGGLNTRISVGEDEIGLVSKLRKFGPVLYNDRLVVKTSNRRYSKGFFVYHKEMLWNYYLGFLLANICQKTIIPAYPDVRN